MAHPAREAILQELVKADVCICNDLVDVLPLSQSTVSQHLSALKKAGLIKGSIDRTSMCYCINDEEWDRIKNTFGNVFESYQGADCC